MHEMQTIVIDDPGHVSHAASLRFSVQTWLLGVDTLGDPRNITSDGSLNFHHRLDAASTKLL